MQNLTCYRRNCASTPWDVDAGGCERSEVREAIVLCGLSILCFLLFAGCADGYRCAGEGRDASANEEAAASYVTGLE